jgi:hypothetical protein
MVYGSEMFLGERLRVLDQCLGGADGLKLQVKIVVPA